MNKRAKGDAFVRLPGEFDHRLVRFHAGLMPAYFNIALDVGSVQADGNIVS